jgi:hypothetical protein
MSVEIPKAAIVFGSVTPPQGDVIDLKVHLGCTKEVSDFECLLQNWNKKYSQGGTSPITEGVHGHIDVGRGTNVPQIITFRVENPECESSPTEHYIRVTGRCWGERIFRRVVTKTYENKKGEYIVRDLVDYYVGLDHCRENSALTSDASSGQKDCDVADGSKFNSGMLVKIKDDNAWEYNEVDSVAGNTVTMVNNLANTYTVAANGKVWIDLIEKTDTTYVKVECDETPVFDLLKYIAGSADKSGVIGYDFRTSPDGKFEFFPKNSKISPITLTDKLEHIKYGRDIHRIRNKITVKGKADKSVPSDKDAWTESLTPDDGDWSWISGDISLDTSFKARGSASIKLHAPSLYYGSCMFTLNDGKEVNANLYPLSGFILYLQKAYNGNVTVALYDIAGKSAVKHVTVGPGEWRTTSLKVGLANELEWEEVESGFDWANVKKFRIDCWFSGAGSGDFWVDGLYFGGRRYSAIREDTASQEQYTDGQPRELVEVDEELGSDHECDLRAQALLDYLKGPAEYVKLVRTTVLDYGNTPLLPGDKVPVVLPNENVDSYFRIDHIEYHVYPATQTLEISADLGKVPPLLADYMYGMRATTVTVEKLARTKLGKGSIPTTSFGGGLGAHHSGHEAGDETGSPWESEDYGGWDKIKGWIAPSHIGPESDSPAIIKFRTKNKAGTQPVDHQFQPSDNEHGVLGCETAHWKEVHTLYLLLYTDGYLRIKTEGETYPRAELDKDQLLFGPGGETPTDVWLRRTGTATLEFKGDKLIPNVDNYTELGAPSKRFKKIHTVEFSVSSHLIPETDNAYDLGEDTTPKRWRDLYLSGAVKALVGGFAVHVLPNADGTYDLGSNSKKWSNIYSNGLCRVGWLNIGDYTVITSARVLQNVTADAAIITSGQFPLARMPRGDDGKFLRAYGASYDPMYASLAAGDIPSLPTSKITSGQFPLARMPRGSNGYVLEAKGASMDPVYVDPDNRYQPAGHNHAAGNITSGVLAETRCPNVYTGQITFNGGIVTNSVNCANWQATDIIFENKFRITEAEKLGLGRGLAFLNPEGRIVMFLDEDGNIQISGELKEQAIR